MQVFSVANVEPECEYLVSHVRPQPAKLKSRSRRPNYGRTGARPSALNGIHRRRNKRYSW